MAGVIPVTVEDRDPQRAAVVANSYLATLDSLNRTLNVTEAGRNRALIESRLKETERDLRKAEENLRRFQEENRAVVLQEQAKVSIDGTAKLNGEIMAAEVQILVGLELARLTREAKVQQTVFELLTQQYEQTNIAGARNTPIVQVLDRAVPAE